MKKMFLFSLIIFGCFFAFIGNVDAKYLFSSDDNVRISFEGPDSECSAMFGDPNDAGSGDERPPSPAYIMYKAFSIMKVAAVGMVIVFSTLDFISAIAASDSEKVTKAAVKSLKRLIVGIIIFLVPTVLDFIFRDIMGWVGTCM